MSYGPHHLPSGNQKRFWRVLKGGKTFRNWFPYDFANIRLELVVSLMENPQSPAAVYRDLAAS
jgi:hypothetical protein